MIELKPTNYKVDFERCKALEDTVRAELKALGETLEGLPEGTPGRVDLAMAYARKLEELTAARIDSDQAEILYQKDLREQLEKIAANVRDLRVGKAKELDKVRSDLAALIDESNHVDGLILETASRIRELAKRGRKTSKVTKRLDAMRADVERLKQAAI